MLPMRGKGNSSNEASVPGRRVIEKLSFGPSSRKDLVSNSLGKYAIKVYERGFEWWAIETTERACPDPVSCSERLSSRCAPFWTTILEINALSSCAEYAEIDRSRNRFLVGARRDEFRRERWVNSTSICARSSELFCSKKSKRVSR